MSPKGTPEGFVCRQGKGTFQINFPPELASEVEKRVVRGEKVEAEVVSFPDAEADAHPVYELRRLLAGDDPLVIDGDGENDVQISGTVISLNHAKRGEINGAILDTGDFVHLRPHGAKAVGLKIGQKLEASGEVRPGWAGCRVIEASHANGISLEKPKKKHPPHHDHHPHHEHDRKHRVVHDPADSEANAGGGEQSSPPAVSSLGGLDWLNFFLADVQTGVGPFLAIYLAGYHWNEQSVGVAMTVGSMAESWPNRPLVNWWIGFKPSDW